MANKIIEKENYNIILIESPKYGNLEVLIDKEDTERISGIHWIAEKDLKGKFYIRNRHKNLRLHRLLTDCPKGLVVDHINHNTLDNRKSNLKICSTAENNKNTNLENKYPNKSTGVYGICKRVQKWKNKNGIEKRSCSFYVQYKNFPKRNFRTLDEAKEYLELCRKSFLGDNYVR